MSSKSALPDNLLCKKTQAAESNKNAILEVLKKELSINATVLEIGSGKIDRENLKKIQWFLY